MSNYTPFHVHTDMSNACTNIDSCTKYNKYIEKAKELGMTAFGFAEHGVVLSWISKKLAIEKAGMKYIHAQEFYVTENIELRSTEDEPTLIRDNYHAILIAKNLNGVNELNDLSSRAFLRDGHFYYQPRITFDELINTSNNILVTTACLGGVIKKGHEKLKQKYIDFLHENRHRCFLEAQPHNDEEQANYNAYLYFLSGQYSIPLIAGTDTHALDDLDLSGRDILQKAKGVRFENEETWDLTFKSYEELIEAFEKQNALPEVAYMSAIENTNKMADMVEPFELDFSHKYPQLYDDSLTVFKQKIVEGIKNRGINKLPNYQEYVNRIKQELEAYIYNGAIDYMLLEEDYKGYLKSKGINFGYSRGSVSGSIIAFLLGVTEVDSIKFGLNFERFMNKERVSLCDIDSDFFSDDRPKIREYLFRKEKLHCCNIITYNTLGLRSAIKEVGRALKMEQEEAQSISDMVEKGEDGNEYIDDKSRLKYKRLFHYVDIVIGTVISVGRHAAGVIVSPHQIDDTFGTMYISSDDKPISQINMKELDLLNYVKLDLLGLDCVGLIDRACKMANIPFLTPENMDFEDMNVWSDISQDTTLIFQFESDFASRYLRDVLSENSINNIVERTPDFNYIDLMSMANGAIRPAGESYREELSQGLFRDNGHEALNDFLAPTLGYLVYQEQIIEFLHKFCGFTLGEADTVRRGFAKKTGTEQYIPLIKDGGYMVNGDKQSDHYIKGFVASMYDKYGVERVDAEVLIENFLQIILDASAYLFSINHAKPYSHLGYAVGYLRHYYPLETLTAALNVYSYNAEKSAKIKEYVEAKGYEIRPLRYGFSGAEYTCDKENNCIYQGIASIKFCNEQIADRLYEFANSNKLDDFIDILKGIKENKLCDSRQLRILTILNFFSDFGGNKKLLSIIDIFEDLYNRKQIKKDDIEQLGIREDLFTDCYNKETEKLYKELDMDKYIKRVAALIEDKPLSIKEQIKYELEFLEYISYVNPDAPKSMYYVVEMKFYKDKSRPYMSLYSLKDGTMLKTKITAGKSFLENPFKEENVLKVIEFREQAKRKMINGSWTKTDELEKVLVGWEVY